MTGLWVTETGVSRHRQDASREGRSICGRRIRYGATTAHDHYEMCGQCERLHNLRAASVSSECAGQSAEAVAEHDEKRHPVPRDPDNPAEDEMTDDDNETYREEQKK